MPSTKDPQALIVRHYLVLHLTFQAYCQISPMLGHTILTTRTEQTTDHIRIVTICPHSCPRKVLREIIFRPKDLLSLCIGTIVRVLAFDMRCRGSEKGSNMLQWLRGASCLLMVFLVIASPCLVRMSSKAVYKYNTVANKYRIPCQCSRALLTLSFLFHFPKLPQARFHPTE